MTIKQRVKRVVMKWPALYRALVPCGRMMILMSLICRAAPYAPKQYCLVPEKKLIYLNNAKAACSSIKASLYDMPEMKNFHDIHTAVWDMGKDVADGDSPKYADYYKFSFVRNPFDRLVSCYENKYHSSTMEEADGKAYFACYLIDYFKEDRGFAEFARRVARIPDKCADEHFVSQYYMLYDRVGKRLVDDVGRFETLEADYEPIRAKYNLAPLRHYNRTEKSGSWMDYYDRKTAVRVYRRYKKDIVTFSYIEAYEALLKHIRQRDGAREG